MTVNASGGSFVSIIYCFGMQAPVIGRLLVSMAGGAGKFVRSSFVRGSLHVGVTIDACEHAAMHRGFKLLGVDVQTHRLAVDVFGEAGVSVASQAILAGWFLRAGDPCP